MAESESTLSIDWEPICEIAISITQLLFICCITYPLYVSYPCPGPFCISPPPPERMLQVMTDKSEPVLKWDLISGFISVPTLAFMSAAYYAVLNLVSKFHDVFGHLKLSVATGVVILLFFGSCDVFNSIRSKNKILKGERYYYDYYNRLKVDRPNARANAVAGFIFIEFLLAVILLVLAIRSAKRENFRSKSRYRKKNSLLCLPSPSD